MNRTMCIKYAKRLALGLAVLALAATPSFAQTIDLCATTGTAIMPDTTSVNIWGFVPGDCTTGSDTATLPGPELRATAGGTLIIDLYTDLPSPVSFFAPGLRADATTGAAGLFTAEATAGFPASYTFSNIKAGTYLYHSGTDINTQVPMGLYGALVVDVAAGKAYADVTYAQDEVLVYSEIDPSLNDGSNADARVTTWSPKYFLINGAPYPGPIGVGTSQSTLLRFVNAGLQTFVPTFDGGLYMDLKAEDGNRYPQPFKQYGIELPAGKTIDAIVNPGTDGTYKLYDRALHAGMLVSLQSGPAAAAPIAANDPGIPGSYTIAEGGSLTADGVSTNPVGVLFNDTPATGLTAVLVKGTAKGTLALAGDGSFTYTPDAYFNGADSFTYKAFDGTLFSDPATVTITVTPVDSAPVAVDDPYEAEVGTPLTVPAPGVLTNDVDVDGALMTASAVGTAPPGTLIFNADGSFDYTPAGAAGAVESFQYEACYPLTTLCSTATVTITIKAVNQPPIAGDNAYATDQDVPLNVAAPGILGNDSDPNSDPLTVALVTNVANGNLTLYEDGSFDYTPNPGFNGGDSFTYVANDGALDSNIATVTITVNLVNDPPFAANDFAAVAKNSGVGDLANTFSVTANDSDTTGGIAVGTVDLNPALPGRQTSVTASRGGTVTADNSGNVTFVPKRGFRGTDTFTYTVQDTLGAVSNVATVRVNVN